MKNTPSILSVFFKTLILSPSLKLRSPRSCPSNVNMALTHTSFGPANFFFGGGGGGFFFPATILTSWLGEGDLPPDDGMRGERVRPVLADSGEGLVGESERTLPLELGTVNAVGLNPASGVGVTEPPPYEPPYDPIRGLSTPLLPGRGPGNGGGGDSSLSDADLPILGPPPIDGLAPGIGGGGEWSRSSREYLLDKLVLDLGFVIPGRLFSFPLDGGGRPPSAAIAAVGGGGGGAFPFPSGTRGNLDSTPLSGV